MPSRLAIAILLAVTWLLPASAQIRIGTTAAGTTAIRGSGLGIAATAGFGGRGMAAGGARRLEHGSRGAILLPYPYFNSDYSDAAVEGAAADHRRARFRAGVPSAAAGSAGVIVDRMAWRSLCTHHDVFGQRTDRA